MSGRASKVSHWVQAYGDRDGDGMVQMSFTLRVKIGGIARETAKKFAELHGLKNVLISTMEECGPGYTYFVAYGHSKHQVDLQTVETSELDIPLLTHDEIDSVIATKIGRKVVIVGACTGSDAHTVGIDAIINMKGYAGEKGLESYKWITAFNLGSQVENEALIARAVSVSADAILVSQVITQRDVHKDNGAALIAQLKKQNLRKHFILLLGGPRIDHKLGIELGFDAGFGAGTNPRQVANFVVQKMLRKQEEGPK